MRVHTLSQHPAARRARRAGMTIASVGGLVSAALLVSAFMVLRDGVVAQAEPAALLLRLLGYFLVTVGVLFVGFALLAGIPAALSRRRSR